MKALEELNQPHSRLVDFGAGAGYFVSAAVKCGFHEVTGYEPSETLVGIGNEMIGSKKLVQHELSETVALIDASDATVASFIGVIEHVRNPREILKALSGNDNIKGSLKNSNPLSIM
jgi:2-polyprenyl-3-methyl-5-hydroxy-6-metoxy-1,4-benzoquinol methylase